MININREGEHMQFQWRSRGVQGSLFGSHSYGRSVVPEDEESLILVVHV